MLRHDAHLHAADGRSRVVRLRRYVAIGITLLAVTACHSFRRTADPSSLSASDALVRVRYATPQRLRVAAAGRDTVLADVTVVEGRPTGVRGDTLQLRLTRWYAGGWFGHVNPPRLDLAVAPGAGTIVEQRHVDAVKTSGAVLLTAGVIAGVGIALFLLGMSSLGPNY